MLVILTPQAMTDPTQTAEALVALREDRGKPVLASWMGGVDVAAGATILAGRHPDLRVPRHRRRVFTDLWRYDHNLHARCTRRRRCPIDARARRVRAEATRSSRRPRRAAGRC